MNSAPYFDDEPLPRLSDLVKHSVWGWRRGDESITPDTPRDGHTFDSVRKKGTFFPERWSDQDIADAIAAAMESPEFIEKSVVRRHARKEIDGVTVRFEWELIPQRGVKATSAYPMFGRGVERFSRSEDARLPWELNSNNEMKKAERWEDG